MPQIDVMETNNDMVQLVQGLHYAGKLCTDSGLWPRARVGGYGSSRGRRAVIAASGTAFPASKVQVFTCHRTNFCKCTAASAGPYPTANKMDFWMSQQGAQWTPWSNDFHTYSVDWAADSIACEWLALFRPNSPPTLRQPRPALHCTCKNPSLQKLASLGQFAALIVLESPPVHGHSSSSCCS